MLLSIGDQIRPGIYRPHSWFRRAVNFEQEGRLISVVDESVGPGPVNIVMRGLRSIFTSPGNIQHPTSNIQHPVPAAQLERIGCWMLDVGCWMFPSDPMPQCANPLSRGVLSVREKAGARGNAPDPSPLLQNGLAGAPAACLPLQVGPGTVLFAGHRYRFTSRQRYHSTFEVPAMNWRRFQQNLCVLAEALNEDASPKSLAFLLDPERRKRFRTGFDRAFAQQITRGVRQVFCANLLTGIRALKGCGPGLTPAGDDFVAGLLIGLHVLQRLEGRDFQPTIDAVFRAARGSNTFSNTFLDLARQGLLFGRLKDLLQALTAGTPGSVRKAAQAMFAIGETSGADLATGLLLTLRGFPQSGKQARLGKPALG